MCVCDACSPADTSVSVNACLLTSVHEHVCTASSWTACPGQLSSWSVCFSCVWSWLWCLLDVSCRYPDSSPSSSPWWHTHVWRGSASTAASTSRLWRWRGGCSAVQGPLCRWRPKLGPHVLHWERWGVLKHQHWILRLISFYWQVLYILHWHYFLVIFVVVAIFNIVYIFIY